MKIFSFFKKLNNRKVYCIDCFNHCAKDQCITGWKDTPLRKQPIIEHVCEKDNANNDCPRFRQSHWY